LNADDFGTIHVLQVAVVLRHALLILQQQFLDCLVSIFYFRF